MPKTKLPAVETFKKMKGRPVNAVDIPKPVLRKFAYSITGNDFDVLGQASAFGVAKALERSYKLKLEFWQFDDGSFGVATSSYLDSFVCGHNAENFLTVPQNDQLKKHGWLTKSQVEKARRDEAKKIAKVHAELAHPLVSVRYAVKNEGFDYAFRCYSSFTEIDDAKFHKLREAYLAAAKALEDYIAE